MDRILVVEDDRELNQGICFALQQAGYETESAYSTQEAKLAGLQQEYSLMILDVNLPDGAQESEGHVSYGKRFGRRCVIRV